MENQSKHFFRKHEKLTSKKLISKTYTKGEIAFVFPIQSRYLVVQNADFRIKILITVSKKLFKNAAHRNKLKRRIREAYRLNSEIIKSELVNPNFGLIISLNYTSKEFTDFQLISESVCKILSQIVSRISQ